VCVILTWFCGGYRYRFYSHEKFVEWIDTSLWLLAWLFWGLAWLFTISGIRRGRCGSRAAAVFGLLLLIVHVFNSTTRYLT
jgi:hypothetical protein